MDKKKLAAATAAVFAYIKTSEEAAAYAVGQPSDSVQEKAGPPMQMQPQNLWGISGRQTHMQANTMMQLRMFK